MFHLRGVLSFLRHLPPRTTCSDLEPKNWGRLKKLGFVYSSILISLTMAKYGMSKYVIN